jgi:hypothetical protein
MLTIVLVHGPMPTRRAGAESSSRSGVIELLQKEVHKVVAGANPVRGLAAT